MSAQPDSAVVPHATTLSAGPASPMGQPGAPKRKRPLWPEARDTLLRKLVDEGTSRIDCMEPLNALDGKPITKVAQIAHRMHALGISLSSEHRSAIWANAASRKANWVWTPERSEYLHAEYPKGTAMAVMMAKLNAMEGPPVASVEALINYANKRGIRRPQRERNMALEKQRRAEAKAKHAKKKRAAVREAKAKAPAPVSRVVMPPPPARRPVPLPLPEPAPAVAMPEPCEELANAAVASRHERAMQALRVKRNDPSDIAKRTGLPLREVYRLAMELRRETAAQ